MRGRWLGWGVALCAALMACAGHTPSNGGVTPRLSVTTTMDTGRLASGHREFSRYDTPGKCRDAVLTARDVVWRAENRDTLPYAPDQDTLPTEAVQVGVACASRFTIQETEPRELRNLTALLLMVNQDDSAERAVGRRVELNTTVRGQGEAIYEAIETYMAAQPMRRRMAESLVKWLELLGRPVLGLHAAAHAVMLEDAVRRFDRGRILAEASTIIADGRAMNAAERDDWAPAIRSAYLALVSLAWYDQPSDIPKLYATAQADVGTLRNGMGGLGESGRPLFRMDLVTSQTLAMLGQPTPRLAAQYWFGAGEDTVRPRPGVVSLLARVDKDCGVSCAPLYATLRRLWAKYGGQGFEITLMTKTRGYAPGNRLQPPAVEAAADRGYFFNALQLPFALAVAKTPFERQRDGRKIPGQVGFEQAYGWAEFVLSDRDGKMVMLSNDWNEARLDAFVRRALGLGLRLESDSGAVLETR